MTQSRKHPRIVTPAAPDPFAELRAFLTRAERMAWLRVGVVVTVAPGIAFGLHRLFG